MPASAPGPAGRRDGPRRRLSPEERRAEIVEAATRVFAERPYGAVTVTEIARAAGASRALVVHYFGDKAGVFAAAAAAFAVEAAQVVRTDLDLPPAEVVATNIDAVLRFAERHRQTVLALARMGMTGDDPRLLEITHRAREFVVDRMLRNHFGTTDVPELHRFALRAYVGLFAVGLAEWLESRAVSRRQAHAFLTQTLLDVVARLRSA